MAHSPAAAKFKAAMGAYVDKVTPRGPQPRAPSGTGAGVAKFRTAMTKAFGLEQAPPTQRTLGTPAAEKFRAGMMKYLSSL
jgi:hypothetical protein